MRYKYIPKSKANVRRRKTDPNRWLSGPELIKHEKYYAWLKHRAQCRFRNETYDIEWADWESLWSDSDFEKRGRGGNDLCLARIDPEQSWSLHNCQVVTRREHLKRNSEFRKTNGE